MAEETHKEIREVLTKLYGTLIADEITMQYGGSMKPENAKDLLAQKNIDGGLVGGHSTSRFFLRKLLKQQNKMED